MDIDAIRQSPRQHVDLETVEWLADRVMVLELALESAKPEVTIAEAYRCEYEAAKIVRSNR